MLRACYENALNLCVEHKIRSVAFSSISTGVFGYPLHSATRVALDTVRQWLSKHRDAIDLVIFCVFPDDVLAAYDLLMPLYFPVTSVNSKSKKKSKRKKKENEK